MYSLTPPAESGGAWTETVLYNYTGASDGLDPFNVVAGPDGVLYGVTSRGASSGCVDYFGCGTVFSLTPPGAPGGAWTMTVLYTAVESYRASGATSLIMGPNQVLYGTIGAGTVPCGAGLCGSVFSLTPPAAPGGAWTEAVLHAFGGPGDGSSPNAGLTLGPNGEIYGTTYFGGSGQCGRPEVGCGTAFELAPPASPGEDWTETILFSFPASPAANAPQAGVAIGKNGVLYGSTRFGGGTRCQDYAGCGVVFALTPPASPDGTWTETILHHFTGGADGAEPYMTPVIAKDGALYGTSSGYGNSYPGTVFIIRHP